MNPYKRIPAWKDCFETFKKNNITFNEIIDVGAAPGPSSFTEEIIKFYPQARYHLIEPQTRFNETLNKIYSGIDFVIYNEIIGSNEFFGYEVGVRRYDNDGATHSLIRTKPESIGWSEELNTEVLYCNTKKIRTLDNLLENYITEDMLLLKVDVDGQDIEVLKGATNILKKVKVLQIEASLFNIAETISYLNSNGFRIIDLVDFCYYDRVLTQVDIICGAADFVETLSMLDAPLHRTTEWNNELLFNFPYMN